MLTYPQFAERRIHHESVVQDEALLYWRAEGLQLLPSRKALPKPRAVAQKAKASRTPKRKAS